MNSNKLLLNTDKTEVTAAGPSSRLGRVNSDSIGRHREQQDPLQNVKTGQTLSMQDQISSVYRASFLELRCLNCAHPTVSLEKRVCKTCRSFDNVPL